MSLPLKSFTGKLFGKNTYWYTSKLDYTLDKYEDRLNKVTDVLKHDDFYVHYFDDYFKTNVNTEEYLSSDNNICKSLEQMANYLLLAPDIKENDDIQYIFYTEDKLVEKIKNDENRKQKTMMFLLDKKRNYRKEAKQDIFNKDYLDDDFNTAIKVYNVNTPDEIIVEQTNYLKNMKDASTHIHKLVKTKKYKNYKQKSKLKEFMKDIKSESILIKDYIKGTIYYNHCLPESTAIDYQLFNFTDINHVLSLLKCPPRNLMDDLGILIYDLNQLIKEINMSKFEKDIINLWRNDDLILQDIAYEMGTTPQNIDQTLRRICGKIIKRYKENYESWLYLNWIKGEYKTCNQCGDTKLTNKFRERKDSFDGFRNTCLKCESSAKNS